MENLTLLNSLKMVSRHRELQHFDRLICKLKKGLSGASLGFYKQMGSSLAFVGLLKESLQLLLGGGLLLLHQVSVAFCDTPAIGFGHRGAEGTA